MNSAGGKGPQRFIWDTDVPAKAIRGTTFANRIVSAALLWKDTPFMQDPVREMSVQQFNHLYPAIVEWAADNEIEVSDREFPDSQAGEFDGLAVTMNSSFHVEERSYYLIHAIGSIISWSLDSTVEEMFDNLRAKMESKEADPTGFESALGRYRSFETTSSEYAVQLLMDLDYRDVIRAYSNFMDAKCGLYGQM
jgi:hypothetical protein